MAEYIEREALLLRIDCYGTNKFGMLDEDIRAFVKAQPAADVAPVVRCKDCKHYRNHPNGLCYLHTEPKANACGYSGEAVCVEPDDFCSCGDPKEDPHANDHD